MSPTAPVWTKSRPPTIAVVDQWINTEVKDSGKALVLSRNGKRAANRFGIAKVEWNLRGLCAGQALVKPMRLRLNPALLTLSADRFDALTDTVLHEVAHLAAIAISPRAGRGHGPLWREIATQLGCMPDRCHKLPLRRHRVMREYAYELSGRIIWLGPRQHAALQRGGRYLCRQTGVHIRPRHFTGTVREEH